MFIVNRNEIDPSILSECDEMIFEELKLYLESINMNTYMVCVIGRSNSFMADEIRQGKHQRHQPIMLFFMKNHEHVKHEYASQIKEKWRELLAYHIYDVDEYHDEQMEFVEIDGEEYIIEQYVRNFKIDIVDFMKSRNIKPKNIYCSSKPAYNIIYERKMEYEEASNEFDFIRMCIKEHLKELITDDFKINVDHLEVNFWNPFMPGYDERLMAKEE